MGLGRGQHRVSMLNVLTLAAVMAVTAGLVISRCHHRSAAASEKRQRPQGARKVVARLAALEAPQGAPAPVTLRRSRPSGKQFLLREVQHGRMC